MPVHHRKKRRHTRSSHWREFGKNTMTGDTEQCRQVSQQATLTRHTLHAWCVHRPYSRDGFNIANHYRCRSLVHRCIFLHKGKCWCYSSATVARPWRGVCQEIQMSQPKVWKTIRSHSLQEHRVQQTVFCLRLQIHPLTFRTAIGVFATGCRFSHGTERNAP